MVASKSTPAWGTIGAVVLLALAGVVSAQDNGGVDTTSGTCPPNTLFEPYQGFCAAINDITSQFGTPYSLGDIPEPGGIGGGTHYAPGTHQALEHAVLHTKMFVQPDGLNSPASDWQLLTPATNHTDSATEFTGIYASYLAEGWFGIFGRPCTVEYPCPDGDTSNGWQAGWSHPFSNFSCNMMDIVDQGGHAQRVMHYANETIKLDKGAPPLWQNAIYLWNDCAGEWDLIWRHQYREAKRDCSIEGCYQWGPILETFGNQAEINELGYEDTLLFHDGNWSTLSAEQTNFSLPITPWVLSHIDPNRGFGIGNNFIDADLGPRRSLLLRFPNLIDRRPDQ